MSENLGIPVKKLEEIAERVKKAYITTVLSDPEVFENEIRSKLEAQFRALVPNLMGLEYRFGEWRIDSDKRLKEMKSLQEKALKFAEEIFQEGFTLSPKARARIVKQAREYYEERVFDLLTEQLNEKAQDYVENLVFDFKPEEKG